MKTRIIYRQGQYIPQGKIFLIWRKFYSWESCFAGSFKHTWSFQTREGAELFLATYGESIRLPDHLALKTMEDILKRHWS